MPSISEQPIGISWLHNGNDVVLFTGTEDYVPSSYKNRITLDRVSAELTIKNATHEDSGVYFLEMDINNERDTFQCEIEVIDKVSKPNISCEMSDTKQATLVCSTESKHPHLLKFKWSSPGKEQTGPKLTITVRNEDDDQVYRCDVSNPLTNETASFTAKDCFLGKRSDALLIFGISCYCIMVIIVCCLLYIIHQHLKARFNKYIWKRRPRKVKDDSVSKQHSESTSTLPSKEKLNKQRKPEEKLDSDMNTTTLLEDTRKDQQVYGGENVKHEDDLLSQATPINRRVEVIRTSNTGTLNHVTMRKVPSSASLKEENIH
ncbi:signaling lymphocytic activation molecule-like isoform X6 [Entelurus aequoreus]|uniref:signaling lymphocytic activation molecule-like isoform X6 n=1 Tax=Entelurus aequoreus TaxID=161455 RepID=UPI002B1DDDA5|nr:signaling lymphocytic activation molecule-like isoform X6 [Entelurus aequoreus]